MVVADFTGLICSLVLASLSFRRDFEVYFPREL